QDNKKAGVYTFHSLKIIGKGKRFIAEIHLADFKVYHSFGFRVVGKVEEHLYKELMGNRLIVHITEFRIDRRYFSGVLFRNTLHFRHFAMLGSNAGLVPDVVSLLVKFKCLPYPD